MISVCRKIYDAPEIKLLNFDHGLIPHCSKAGNLCSQR